MYQRLLSKEDDDIIQHDSKDEEGTGQFNEMDQGAVYSKVGSRSMVLDDEKNDFMHKRTAKLQRKETEPSKRVAFE